MLRFDAIPVSVRELLIQLTVRPELTDFMLGGGTSLALRFGHRLSIDLDFFTARVFEPVELMQGLTLENVTEVGRATNSLTLDVGGVKVDFLRHAYPLLELPDRIEGVGMLAIPDVSAMKLNAIANRGAKKDFFDVAMLLRFHSLDTLLGWFEAKYRNSDRFTVIRSLGWFEDAENEPDPLSLIGETWDKTKSQIRAELAALR